MNRDEDLEEVQRILNYRFRDITLLSDALTAAGADLDNYEGNRSLAPIGVDVIHLCLDFDARQKKGKPSKTAVLKQQLCCYKHLASVAQRTSLDKCIRYNPRSGKGIPTVVGKSLAAIIAAAYLDSGNHSDTWGVMHYIGFFIQNEDGINPAMLESNANCEAQFPLMDPLVAQCNIPSNVHTSQQSVVSLV
jgi:dsRNA-specific ribonuclease